MDKEEAAQIRAQMEADRATLIGRPRQGAASVKRPKPKAPDFLAASGCLLLVVALFCSFGYLGYAMWGDFRSGQNARASRSQAQAEAQAQRAAGVLSAQDPLDMEVACESAVKDRLSAPATAQFTKDATANWSGSGWRYSGTVDSQNGFGALLRSRFTCGIEGTTREDAKVSVDFD